MTQAHSSADVTQLLQRWSRGDAAAADRLVPIVYAQLRRMASRHLRQERNDHTLSPTALVNELYLRLVDQRRTTWQNRAHFFGVAAQLMRRILVDYARAHAAEKRGAGSTLIPLGELPRRYQELPRDREIVTQCKMGGRSAKAQDFLKSVGFTNVKNLRGGILEWIDKVDPSQPKY